MKNDSTPKNNSLDLGITSRRRSFLKWTIMGLLTIGPVAKGLHYVLNKPRVHKLVLFPPFREISYTTGKPNWSKTDVGSLSSDSPDSIPSDSCVAKKGNMGVCEFVSVVVSRHGENASIIVSFKERQDKKSKKYQMEMIAYDRLQNILGSEIISDTPQTESGVFTLGGRDIYISSTKTIIMKMSNDLLASIDHILVLTTDVPVTA